MGKCYTRVKGTIDFYPPYSNLFQSITDKAKELFQSFGYQEIILPVLEEEAVFARSIGEVSDIVEKQMFRIKDKNIVLRPEATAQVVRFYLEHGLYKQGDFHKFFYIGAMFRGEKPQKGRLRQFHHIGAEALGADSPYIDFEIIKLATLILESCGVKDFSLKINSLGCKEDKRRLVVMLKEKLVGYKDKLCFLCKQRLEKNPLRVLDCKNIGCKELTSSLTLGKEHLCDECSHNFKELLTLMEEFNVSYVYDPKLVRGLDYYTNTVFELESSRLGAQSACGGGGRYNDLVKNLGGPHIPAVGFALGLERIMLLLKKPQSVSSSLVFVAYTSSAVRKEAFKILDMLRENRVMSDTSFKNKSLKSQLRFAQKIGAKFTVIVGDKELGENQVILRDMERSLQERIEISQLLKKLAS